MTLLATVALLSVGSADRSRRATPPSALASPAALATGVTGAQFQAGNIISDAVFYNSSTMNATTIQAFLNQEAPSSCPGATCLNVFHMATTSQPAESGLCSAYTGKSSETAAQIFANVASACGVNPEVLLVIAQKESSAVTSSSPNYTTTMGYGCPDSTGCAAKYFGFFNQVYLAARQFKLYRLHPDNYGYVAGENNYILYNPKVSCGGSQVFIQNQATAGLYDYTPYQPDAAALANLHGTGDSCSAYGNRNFWVFFNSWFGATTGLSTVPQPYDRGGLLAIRPSDGSIWEYGNRGILPPLMTEQQLGSSPHVSSVVGTGDFTGDGLADLLTVTSAGALVMYQNTGTSLPYGAPTSITTGGWGLVNRLLIADVNGDGRADVIETRSDGVAGYYPSSGNPARPLGTPSPLAGNWNNFTALAAGDVNGDGFADIIAKEADGSLFWLPGTGIPSHPFGSWTKLSPNLSAYDMIVADDMTLDGRTDLIARKPNGSLWMFVNSRSPTNPFGTPIEIGASGWSQFGTLQPLTVPVPHRNEQANLVVRDPAGTGSLDSFLNSSPPNPFVGAAEIGTGGWSIYRLVVAADLNGDGRDDLVAIDKNGIGWIYPNTGVASRPYGSRVLLSRGWGAVQTLLAGDINGDGRDDLVARTTSGALDLYLNTGSSTTPFGSPVQIGAGWNSWPTIVLADTNGDHKADLLAVSRAGQLVDYLGSGGTAHPFSTYVILSATGWQDYTHLIPVTRTTAAGIAPSDLLAISADGSGRFYRNTGLPSRPYLGSIALAGRPWAGQLIITGGFATGSGLTDTVGTTATGTGTLSLDTNHGTDVFGKPIVIGASGWNADDTIELGDVTGDGRDDLITRSTAGALSMYVAGTNPAAPFGSPIVIQSHGWTFTHTLVGDATGDGRADLIATKADGTLWIYPASSTVNRPYGGIPERQIGTGWQSFTTLALGDVNGDGLADLVGVKADGTLWLAVNTHNPAAPYGTPVQIGSGWQVYSTLLLGDVNHDGVDDLVGIRPDGSAWYCANITPLYPTTPQPFQACVPTTAVSWNSYDLAAL